MSMYLFHNMSNLQQPFIMTSTVALLKYYIQCTKQNNSWHYTVNIQCCLFRTLHVLRIKGTLKHFSKQPWNGLSKVAHSLTNSPPQTLSECVRQERSYKDLSPAIALSLFLVMTKALEARQGGKAQRKIVCHTSDHPGYFLSLFFFFKCETL